jgi:hypothetical protein
MKTLTAHSACAIALIAGTAIFATAASAQQFGTADEAPKPCSQKRFPP